MKIMYIAHSVGLEGANQSLLNIIEKLEKEQAEIYVVTPEKEGSLIDKLKLYNVNIISETYYPWRATKTQGLKRHLKFYYHWIKWHIIESEANKRSAYRLSKIVEQEKIELIHTNCSTINVGALIKRELLRRGKKINHVWHLREFGDKDFAQEYLPSIQSVSKLMNMYTDVFVCISKAVSDHYSYIEKCKKTVIYNGVPIVSENTYNDRDTIKLLVSGRIGIEKGQDTAIIACEILSRMGYCNFELYLAGKGALKRPIPEAIAKQVHMLGFVDNMREVRKDIDIELVCSRSEAFGRVTAEAMMCGITVVGTRSGGTPELIEDGKTGFLFEYNNANQLAKIIAKLIDDTTLRKKIGIAGRERAIKLYSIDRCVENILILYSQITKEKKKV